MTKTKKTKTLNALKFNQNGSEMIVTSMTANQLLHYTKVDSFNPDLAFDDESQGYQRSPSKARVRRLGNFLDKNVKEQKGFPMPTAILLSDRGCNMETSNGSITFPIDAKFPILDGQHRVEGMRHAIEFRKNEELSHYSYPVVIIKDLDKLKEMEQFRTVNGTAKSVNTALVNMMLTQRK